MSLKYLINKIGTNELINAILVENNVRPAMLIQPADYTEATGKDKKTKSILLAQMHRKNYK